MTTYLETDPSEKQAVGRDPRAIDQSEFGAWGHHAKPILSVIRAKCLDCCGEQIIEVRRCTAITCALWPYRMGSNPLREKREMTDEARNEVAERFKRAREAKNPL